MFVTPTDHPRVLAALGPLGVDARGRLAAIERDGQARWWWGRTPIDLFFAYDEIHADMRSAARRMPFGDARIPVLAPEHLAVCKEVYDRPKDWIDIEQMLVGAPDLEGGVRPRLARSHAGAAGSAVRALRSARAAGGVSA